MDGTTAGVLVVVWIVLAVAIAGFAESKGKDRLSYFLVSLFLSPLIGLLMAVIATPDTAKVEAKKVEEGTDKKCPFCAELIKREAIVCRYCTRDLPATAIPDAGPAPVPAAAPAAAPDPFWNGESSQKPKVIAKIQQPPVPPWETDRKR